MIVDLSGSISYGSYGYPSFALNDVTHASTGVLRGFSTEEVRFLPVEGFGYREKRSLADGYDFGPVYLGKRDIYLRGVCYGENEYDLAQRLYDFRAAMTPTLAYAHDPLNHGFLPLTFTFPYWQENQSGNFTVYARPYEQPGNFVIPETASIPGQPGSFVWEARFECRDPRFYLGVDASVSSIAMTGATFSGSINAIGNGRAPVSLILVTTGTGAVTHTFNGLGTVFTLNVPEGLASSTIVTVDSALKVVTVKQPDLPEVLRMDIIEFAAGNTWPVLPQGNNPISSTTTAASQPYIYLYYRDSFY